MSLGGDNTTETIAIMAPACFGTAINPNDNDDNDDGNTSEEEKLLAEGFGMLGTEHFQVLDWINGVSLADMVATVTLLSRDV